MMRVESSLKVGVLAAVCAALVLFAASAVVTTQSADGAAGLPAFLRADRCYQFTFSIAGAPNWKVLELLDDGWITAEVDAGPRSATRETIRLNTAQIVTARDVRCSE